jgi:hypothetical protein
MKDKHSSQQTLDERYMQSYKKALRGLASWGSGPEAKQGFF